MTPSEVKSEAESEAETPVAEVEPQSKTAEAPSEKKAKAPTEEKVEAEVQAETEVEVETESKAEEAPETAEPPAEQAPARPARAYNDPREIKRRQREAELKAQGVMSNSRSEAEPQDNNDGSSSS